MQNGNDTQDSDVNILWDAYESKRQVLYDHAQQNPSFLGWVSKWSNHTWLKAKPWTKRPSMQGLGADSYLSKLHAI